MNNDYLRHLIDEVQQRDGGILLNLAGRTEAVVLSIDRYNQLLIDRQSFSIKKSQSVLVTGGAGHIGASVVDQLVTTGHKVVVVDDMSTGQTFQFSESVSFIEADIRDVDVMRRILVDNGIEIVFHLAGSSNAVQSFDRPVEYLHNNVIGTAAVLQAMADCNIKTIIFSSTAAVYGHSLVLPIAETAVTIPTTPYGASKLICEQLIQYYCQYAGFQGVVFRYCEDSITSAIAAVLSGKQSSVMIAGRDHDTFDGTCIRDYAHVADIAQAYLMALEKLSVLPAYSIYNIGAGRGYSMENIIQTAAEITGKMIPLEFGPRLANESPAIILDTTKIRSELGFEPSQSELKTIIESLMLT